MHPAPALPLRMKLLYGVVALLACIALVKGISALSLRLWYEAQGPYTFDSTLYWTVGRGITNGLMPYRDLYENKPPGIFLLSALSFWLTGDQRWTVVFQVFALLTLLGSILFGTIAIRRFSDHPKLLIGIGALFGILLTLYAAERSGEFQVESLGAAFACVYVALLAARHRQSFGKRDAAIGAASILGAFLMKEPFAVIIIACALLLIHNRRTFVHNFLKPSAFAAAAFLLLIPIGGKPYFTVYLREMFGNHIYGAGSPWERGLMFGRVWDDLTFFNPLLGWIIALSIGLLLVRYAVIYRPHREAIPRLMALLLALYLGVFTIGLGGHFYNHHFSFAVPLYAALFFACLSHSFHLPRGRILHRFPAALGMLALAGSSFLMPELHYENRLATINAGTAVAQEAAQSIDEILDRCGVDRYLFLGQNGQQPFAYTKHSPLGPLFFQYDYYFSRQRPEFRASFLQSLNDARIIIRGNASLGDLQPTVGKYLSLHFRDVPWPCADAVAALPDGFRVYYRYSE